MDRGRMGRCRAGCPHPAVNIRQQFDKRGGAHGPRPTTLREGLGRICRGGALAPLAPSDEGAVSRKADWGRDKAGKKFLFSPSVICSANATSLVTPTAVGVRSATAEGGS